MSGFLPLRPGLWWMRRWHLPGKLITLGMLMAGALAMAAMDAPWWSVALAGAVVLYALCALYMGLASDLQSVAHAMEQTTRGDLSARAGVNGRDEVGSMAQSLDRMVLTLSSMVADIRSNAALVAHAGQSLAQGNRSLAERTEQQAANLEQTAASVEQLSSAVQNNAQTARSADARAAEVRKAADSGIVDMNDIVEIWRSSPIPEGPVVLRKALSDETKTTIIDLLSNLHANDPDCAYGVAAGETAGFTPVTHDEYATIIEIRRAEMN